MRLSLSNLLAIGPFEVDSDQIQACLVHSEQCVGRTDGWDGMVIIGRRQSKSTFGVNKYPEAIAIAIAIHSM